MDGVKVNKVKQFLGDVKESFKTLKWYEWLMTAVLIVIAGYAMVSAFVSPDPGGNPPWLTIVNFVSAICGVVCIFFCAKANITNFAFGLINTVVYIVYLAYWKIYGTLCLEVFLYFPINIISWIVWAKHKDTFDPLLTKSKKLTWYMDVLIAFAVVAAAWVYHLILVRVGGTVPWLDAFTVSIGIVATVLEMLRYREQYVLWLITDFIAVAMYIVHFDPVYLTKKGVYTVMAVVGLINWIKLNKERNAINE